VAGGSEGAGFELLTPEALAQRLAVEPAPLVLDVRRRSAFGEGAQGIPGAIAIVLDDDPIQLPDLPRERAVVVYCLCRGEASSSRVARWLVHLGYRAVAVLEGGLGAWIARGGPVVPISVRESRERVAWVAYAPSALEVPGDLYAPRLVRDALLPGRSLPLRRRMTVLFVDMVESTRLLSTRSTEDVLRIVQDFMEVVAEVGALHCGDVHDFEGDGALLYFEGAGEAVPAAFALRERLLARRRATPGLPLPRISLDEGPLVIGMVGGRFRRSIALVGPSVPRAARILHLAPPGGIVATEAVVELARESSPELAARFVPSPRMNAASSAGRHASAVCARRPPPFGEHRSRVDLANGRRASTRPATAAGAPALRLPGSRPPVSRMGDRRVGRMPHLGRTPDSALDVETSMPRPWGLPERRPIHARQWSVGGDGGVPPRLRAGERR
jgi:class 3 adenylate cyclase/rhodanese-related sulfurtransferase